MHFIVSLALLVLTTKHQATIYLSACGGYGTERNEKLMFSARNSIDWDKHSFTYMPLIMVHGKYQTILYFYAHKNAISTKRYSGKGQNGVRNKNRGGWEIKTVIFQIGLFNSL